MVGKKGPLAALVEFPPPAPLWLRELVELKSAMIACLPLPTRLLIHPRHIHHQGITPLRFPEELWQSEIEKQLAGDVAEAFGHHPVVLTDQLTNSVYLTPPAEELLCDSAEALVNRLSLSLLGFGRRETIPRGVTEALQGQSEPWRGVVNLGDQDNPRWYFVHASAVLHEGKLVCGVLRFSKQEAGTL